MFLTSWLRRMLSTFSRAPSHHESMDIYIDVKKVVVKLPPDSLGDMLEGILQQLVELKETLTDMDARFTALFAAIDAETTRIAVAFEALLAKLQQGGMTKDEEDAAFAAGSALVERMKSIAVDPENPVPDPTIPV